MAAGQREMSVSDAAPFVRRLWPNSNAAQPRSRRLHLDNLDLNVKNNYFNLMYKIGLYGYDTISKKSWKQRTLFKQRTNTTLICGETRKFRFVRICKWCGTFTRLKRQVCAGADRRRDRSRGQKQRGPYLAPPRFNVNFQSRGGRKEASARAPLRHRRATAAPLTQS